MKDFPIQRCVLNNKKAGYLFVYHSLRWLLFFGSARLYGQSVGADDYYYLVKSRCEFRKRQPQCTTHSTISAKQQEAKGSVNTRIKHQQYSHLIKFTINNRIRMRSRKQRSSAWLLRANALGFLLYMRVAEGWLCSKFHETRLRLFGFRSDNDPEILASMDTCLAVVPPDDAWDRLQRARHVARDTSYTQWPPAIRLLHPFLRDTHEAALKVAEVIEKENIEPFTVKLDQWSIIPHVEALEMDWEAMQQLPDDDEPYDDDSESASGIFPMSEEDRAIQELIAREERIGREKLKERQRREQSKQQKKGEITSIPSEKNETDSRQKVPKSSERSLLRKQKQMYEEFNGPTVVVLEPDEESKEKLKNLRKKLIEGLFKKSDERCYFTGAYSPSSTVSDIGRLPKSVAQSMEEDAFRPLVPIAAFPTVTSAMETARKLRALWQPLTFEVTDLHLVSSGSSTDEKGTGKGAGAWDIDYQDNREYQMFHQQSFQSSNAWSGSDDEWRLDAKQFGCDAMVMLVGEEEPMDDELNQEMVNLICERGISGGHNIPKTESASIVENDRNEKPKFSDETSAELEKWLIQDDDFDEGSVVVIGRTHFFTGEMRNYVGMPAFSVIDGKDRVLGDRVSGAARRRGAIHRSSSTLQDQGNWGRNDVDYLPRTNKQKARQKRSRNTSSAQRSKERKGVEENIEDE